MSSVASRSPKFDNMDDARKWAQDNAKGQKMLMTVFRSTPEHPPTYQLVPSHHIRATDKNPNFYYLIVKRHDYSLGIRPVKIIEDWE